MTLSLSGLELFKRAASRWAGLQWHVHLEKTSTVGRTGGSHSKPVIVCQSCEREPNEGPSKAAFMQTTIFYAHC